MRRKILLMVFVLALLVVGSGCDFFKINNPDGGEGHVADWYPPTNPKIALQNLEWCYNNAEYYDRYETLIHDNFTFYFSEHDVNDPDDPLPATYNKTEDLQSTRDLFENDGIGAENIDLHLDIKSYLPPGGDATTERVSHIPYDLYVNVPAREITYHANHTASFELTRQDDDDDDSEDARWYISKWWDEYTGG